MQKIKKIRFFYWFWLLSVAMNLNGQTHKGNARINNMEKTMKAAEMKVVMYEKKVALCDTTINQGIRMILDAKKEYKEIKEDNKQLDKDYSSNVKPLIKQLGSKNDTLVTNAKIELKALDNQLLIDIKALDNRGKNASKLETKGRNQIVKGKKSKKSSLSALKKAREALETATERYNAAVAASETTK